MNPNALRESPSQSTGFLSGVYDAIQAFRGSTQKMTPKQAVREIREKIHLYFTEGAELDFEWLDRINRLLWVLTSKGDMLLEQKEDLENILRIWETATSIYHDKGYKRKDAKNYARQDPRKNDLSLEELLLQIIGRCKVLEELYIKVHSAEGRIKELSDELEGTREMVHTADSRIHELSTQLRGTLEEEKRLVEKLRLNGTESVRAEFNQKLDELQKRYIEEIKKLETANAELEEKDRQLKSELSLLKTENRSLQERVNLMSFRIKDLQEEVEKHKEAKSITETVEVIQEVQNPLEGNTKELIKTLRSELAKLSKENKQLYAERDEVIAHYSATVELRTKILAESNEEKQSQETQNRQFKEIKEALEQAGKDYEAGYNNPLAHSEALYTLLREFDSILKK